MSSGGGQLGFLIHRYMVMKTLLGFIKWLLMYSLSSIKFLLLLEKIYFFYFSKASYAKTLPYNGSHLGFSIDITDTRITWHPWQEQKTQTSLTWIVSVVDIVYVAALTLKYYLLEIFLKPWNIQWNLANTKLNLTLTSKMKL